MIKTVSPVSLTSITPLVTAGSQIKGNLLEGSYRVERFHGEGQTGQVYQVTHLPSLAHYALRVLRPEHTRLQALCARLRTEAGRLVQLRSEHLVSLVDWGLGEDGLGFLVMEWVDGETLAAYLDGLDRSVPLREVREFCQQAGAALEAAHGCGVTHGALNPANVFRVPGPDGAICYRLADPQLALWIQLATADGAPVFTGTPAYLSPEQACREVRAIGPRSDQFSLAAILYEMLTPQRKRGYRAFVQPGDSPADVLRRVQKEDPTPLALPEAPAIEGAIGRALNRAPERRFASIADFTRQICPPPPARRPRVDLHSAATLALPPARRAPRPRRRAAVAFAIAGLALAAGLLGIALRRDRPTPTPPAPAEAAQPRTQVQPPAPPPGPAAPSKPPAPRQVPLSLSGPASSPAKKPRPPRAASPARPVFTPPLGQARRQIILDCLGSLPRGALVEIRQAGAGLRVSSWRVPGVESDPARECLRSQEPDAGFPPAVRIEVK